MPVPADPKIYHIVHLDRLPSIIADGVLWCDAEIVKREPPGTAIGMNEIKQRRLNELILDSHPHLHVGDCVPFYFCPRSIMLYLIHQANHPEITYTGGQDFIIHLETSMQDVVTWADTNNKKWAFTLSNAGAYYFEDRADLEQLNEIDWDAVNARQWRDKKEGKQAEFLIENLLPWPLISNIGVYSQEAYTAVRNILNNQAHQPVLEIKNEWYY